MPLGLRSVSADANDADWCFKAENITSDGPRIKTRAAAGWPAIAIAMVSDLSSERTSHAPELK
jgi:hypothetical protein